MSIYASFFAIEDERQWMAELEAGGISAGVIRDGDPDPEDLDAPIVYQGSHVLPADDDPRGGSVHLALIPRHITREGRDVLPGDGPPHPWLRLSVNTSDVVLTRDQAARLRDALSEWVEDQEER